MFISISCMNAGRMGCVFFPDNLSKLELCFFPDSVRFDADAPYDIIYYTPIILAPTFAGYNNILVIIDNGVK